MSPILGHIWKTIYNPILMGLPISSSLHEQGGSWRVTARQHLFSCPVLSTSRYYRSTWTSIAGTEPSSPMQSFQAQDGKQDPVAASSTLPAHSWAGTLYILPFPTQFFPLSTSTVLLLPPSASQLLSAVLIQSGSVRGQCPPPMQTSMIAATISGSSQSASWYFWSSAGQHVQDLHCRISGLGC